MPKKISVFRSPEGKAQYHAAYEAVLKEWPVPYEELFISTRLGDTHVIASGPKEAAPVVLLHPAGGGGVIWIRNVGPLSQHFRTYAIDTISETNKSVLTRPISIRHQRQEFTDWMADLLDGLKVELTDIIGNSFGGFLALNTALDLPNRVRKVVLISPAATFVPIPAWVWHFMPANAIGLMIGSKRMLLKPYEWIWQDFPREGSIYQLRAVTAVTGVPRHWSPSVFSDEELRHIQNPVLLLIGDHEVIYKPERAMERAARLVPNLKAVIVPNANHIAEYTEAEFVNRQILDFLSQ
ncbi:MAG: alpha/beta hydrolase [Anaerolineales bacterium]|jgi:pimeloyl-ACP methyl ester carboxylesterase